MRFPFTKLLTSRIAGWFRSMVGGFSFLVGFFGSFLPAFRESFKDGFLCGIQRRQ